MSDPGQRAYPALIASGVPFGLLHGTKEPSSRRTRLRSRARLSVWMPPYDTPVTPIADGVVTPWSTSSPSRCCVSRSS